MIYDRRAMHSTRIALVALLVLGCKGGSSSSSAGASGSSSAASGADVLPAVEVTSPRPKYALGEVSDKALEKLVAKSGWTPTVVGKSPPGDGGSTIRVAAFQKQDQQKLEAVVLVRCGKQAGSSSFEPGEAYFRDGACHMSVAVRLGIRNKTEESKRLLESLLAAS